MISTKRLPTSGLAHRLTISCSTPQSSGNSERITLPPSATTKSATFPNAGFAEIPEKPSDAPHSIPMVSLERGDGSREISFAFCRDSKVCRMACPSISRSDLCFCCSNTSIGLSNAGFLFPISSSRIDTWACWQPRLRMVAPATFGLFR